MAQTRYIIYARKSTDDPKRQALSIKSQIFELRQYSKQLGLEVIDELSESRSAKTVGRPVFNAMLDRIEAGDATGILAWHPDRLARNGTDGSRIIELLDAKVLCDLKFPTTGFETTPQGKFSLAMAFAQGKYYSDSLGENTKRGLREKVRRGECPGWAPIGYLNDYRTKRFIVDREIAPFVKAAFELYAAGDATIDTVREYFADHGILTTTRNHRFGGGKQLSRSRVSKILSNPIYYGHFLYLGELHEGSHDPIISKTLFDDVQTRLARQWPNASRDAITKPKAFLKLFHCAECGGAITAETQKGHVYYRCTKKSKNLPCNQPYVREELLDVEVSRILSPYSLCSAWADNMVARLAAERRELQRSAAVTLATKQTEASRIGSRLTQLLDVYLDGIVDRESYVAKKASLLGQKKKIEEEIDLLTHQKSTWLEPFERWISTARSLGKIVATGSLTEKRVLAEKVFGSNLVLDRKKARGEAVNPWAIFDENVLSHDWVGLYEAARTFFMGQSPDNVSRT